MESPQHTFPGYRVNLPILQNKYIYDRANSDQKLLDEKLPLHVCLYKHMYLFDYIAIFVSKFQQVHHFIGVLDFVLKDFDEMFVPQQNLSSWSEMMKEINRGPKKIYKSERMLRAYGKGIRAATVSNPSKDTITSYRLASYYFKPPKEGTLPMMDATLRDPVAKAGAKSILNPALVKVRNKLRPFFDSKHFFRLSSIMEM